VLSKRFNSTNNNKYLQLTPTVVHPVIKKSSRLVGAERLRPSEQQPTGTMRLQFFSSQQTAVFFLPFCPSVAQIEEPVAPTARELALTASQGRSSTMNLQNSKAALGWNHPKVAVLEELVVGGGPPPEGSAGCLVGPAVGERNPHIISTCYGYH